MTSFDAQQAHTQPPMSFFFRPSGGFHVGAIDFAYDAPAGQTAGSSMADAVGGYETHVKLCSHASSEQLLLFCLVWEGAQSCILTPPACIASSASNAVCSTAWAAYFIPAASRPALGRCSRVPGSGAGAMHVVGIDRWVPPMMVYRALVRVLQNPGCTDPKPNHKLLQE
jgi:hypothetical protein